MSHKPIRKVCIVHTVYSLFLYVLINYKDIDDTFFFFTMPINVETKKKFSQSYQFNPYKNKFVKHCELILLRIFATLRWPFLKQAELFGHDHNSYDLCLIGNRTLILIEDGICNYLFKHEAMSNMSMKIHKLIFGKCAKNMFGRSDNVHRIILTGIKKNVPGVIKNKVKWIDIEYLYNSLTKTAQQKILSLFNITMPDVDFLKSKKIILFTQPFDIDQLMMENEKIEIYRKILVKYDAQDVVIKRHPREKTNYSEYIPDIVVFEKSIPMEIFTLLGVRFDTAITVFSTAVLTLNYPIKIDWIGTSVHKNLEKVYGTLRLEDFKQ